MENLNEETLNDSQSVIMSEISQNSNSVSKVDEMSQNINAILENESVNTSKNTSPASESDENLGEKKVEKIDFGELQDEKSKIEFNDLIDRILNDASFAELACRYFEQNKQE